MNNLCNSSCVRVEELGKRFLLETEQCEDLCFSRLEMPTAIENSGMTTSEERLPVNGTFSSGSPSPDDEVRSVLSSRYQFTSS